MINSGPSSPARVKASPSTNRPSASVLPISTEIPARLDSTSPGRKALPAIAFSTAGISKCKCTFKCACMISCAKASACAAPPMSFFISAMPGLDLISSPPESKHTPLPMIATLGCLGLPQISSIKRGAWLRAAARPTMWIIG